MPPGAASKPAAPADSGTVQPRGESSGKPTATPAVAGPALTRAEVRAKMAELSKLPGKGMEACLGALGAFRVSRVSDLPAAQYTDFVRHIEKMMAA